MKAINNLEILQKKKNGICLYQIFKSLVNENNYTDEDFEYEIPYKRKSFAKYRGKYSK